VGKEHEMKKGIRIVLSIMAVTSVMASLGVTSAFGSTVGLKIVPSEVEPPHITAEKYPVDLNIASWSPYYPPRFSFPKAHAEFECKQSFFDGDLTEATSVLNLLETGVFSYYNCGGEILGYPVPFGAVSIAMNGCNWQHALAFAPLHKGAIYQAGSSLVCPAGKSLVLNIYTTAQKENLVCSVTIPGWTSGPVSSTEMENVPDPIPSQSDIGIVQRMDQIHYIPKNLKALQCFGAVNGTEVTDGFYESALIMGAGTI
jgi:hypothetical protein